MKRRRIFRNLIKDNRPHKSFLRSILAGSLYRVSDIRGSESLADIHTQIDTMRALARDSQINTALSYYATDATTVNTKGQIIWATSNDPKNQEVAEIINKLFERWNINAYARDHILELATIGNLYIPTTHLYKDRSEDARRVGVALDNNTIAEEEFDIIPSTKLDPESVVHLWFQGKPEGYIYQPDDDQSNYDMFTESSIVHFSLGGLLGDYWLDTVDKDHNPKKYDIQFAQPLMDKAVQPTQTLSLLEDSLLLASLTRVVKFINVECGGTDDELEIRDQLQQIKDIIENQLSLNTDTGDAQSFINPQSPNNLIYVPKVNGQDAISITDLNMAPSTEQDNNLLNHYQDKKLSVLGIPKEAMNFSSNEGLGGAGAVMSQRSALYANSLQRLMTAYIAGWTSAINIYFQARGMSGFIGKYQLHMNPIITTQSTIQFEKRDAALSQATSLVTLLKDLKVKDKASYQKAISEILSEVLPQVGSEAVGWNVDVSDADNSNSGGDGF